MAYFDYDLSLHLFRPSSIPLGVDTEYPVGSGKNSTVPITAFNGSYINKNFFNLAASAVDNTSRIVILENQSSIAEDPDVGYIRYTGKTQTQGALYGGNTLILPLSGSPLTLTFPLTWNSPYYGFKMAVGNAIQYTGTAVNTVDTMYTDFLFNSTNPTNFSSSTNFLTYLNSVLNKSINPTSTLDRATVVGVTNPSTYAWDVYTTPKKFTVYWNNGYEELQASGTTLNVATVSITSAVAANNSTIATVVQSAIRSAIASVDPVLATSVSVYNNGTNISFVGNSGWQLYTEIADGGVYEVTLKADPTSSDPILEWLGWITSPATSVSVYDYSKLIDFSINETSNLVTSGRGASFKMTLQDGLSGSGNFFSHVGTTVTSGVLYEHSMLPDSSWERIINFGGGLRVSSLDVSGGSRIRGVAVFDSGVEFNDPFVTVPGGLKIIPTYASGTTFLAFTAVAIGTDGKVYPADKTDANKHVTIGIALDASTAPDQTIRVVTNGTVTSYGSGLTLGSVLYMSTAGALTATESTITAGQYKQFVAIAISSTDIFVRPGSPIVVTDPNASVPSRISYYGNNGTSVPIATSTTIPFVTKDYDTYPGYTVDSYSNVTPGYYVVPVTGTYLITCSINITLNTALAYSYSLDVISTSTLSPSYSSKKDYSTGNPGVGGSNLSAQLYAQAGDTIRIAINNTGSNAFTLVNNSTNRANYLQITKIGA